LKAETSVQIARVENGPGCHRNATGDRYVSISIEISRLDGNFAARWPPDDAEQAFTGNAGFHPKRSRFFLTAVSHWYYLFAGFETTVSHRPYFSKVCAEARIKPGPAIRMDAGQQSGTEG